MRGVNQNLDAAGDASTHANECCWLQLEIKQETQVHLAHAFLFVFVHTVEINDRSVESDPLNDVLCMQPRGETLQQA